jgi:SNF2 family DNA or RNA helicase
MTDSLPLKRVHGRSLGVVSDLRTSRSDVVTVTAELADDGFIYLDTDWVHKDITKAIPGSKWEPKLSKWRIPISWSACLALRGTFKMQLEIGPRLAEWANQERTTRIDPCNYYREQLDAPGDRTLFGWQRSGVEFIAAGRQVLIGDEMGSGKSATTIRGIAELYRRGEDVFPILIVCPNSVKNSWKRELDTWWPGLTVSVIKGSAVQRRKALATDAHVYVINTEALRSHSRLAPYGSVALKRCRDHGGEDPKVTENACHVHPRELNKFKFRTVVADEAHRFKDPKSQQTRALWAAAGDAEFRIALTGTPIANDVTDLWPILHFLAPHEWASKTRWIDRFVDTMLNAWNGLVVIGIKAAMYDEFYAALNPRFRRMPEELILKHLPPVLYEQRDCEMSAKQAKAYKQMKDDMVAELETGMLTVGKGGPMIKAARLSQFASSYAEVEVIEGVDEHGFPTIKQKVTLTEPSAKLDTFMETIPDFGTNQVAVTAVSRQLIELLSKRLDKAKIPHGLVTGRQSEDERTAHIDDFQAGKTQFILFTAGAGGTGITLTAARFLCRLQRPYSLIDDRQVLKRVKRIGSERHENIVVIDFVTANTVDTAVKKALDKKGISFEEVVRDKDAFLRILKGEDEDEE